MKVLVTGANGFLGRHLVDALLRRGHRVRALVRPAARIDSLRWSGVEVFRADLRAAGDLAGAFEGVDALVHLAAAVSGGEDLQYAATVVGTERLLGAMALSATRRLVLASSFSVYDWSRIKATLDETSPLAAGPELYERDGYAIAKVWQERVARQMAERHGWALTVLRPGFIWGRDRSYLACLGQAAGRIHFTIGPWTRLPLTHVENCADLFARAVDHRRAAGETFNVVDGDDIRAWSYAGDHIRGTGAGWLRVPVPFRLARVAVALAYRMSKWIFRGKGKLPGLLVPRCFEARFKPLRFSSLKTRRVLDWEPPLTYAECLRRTYVRNSQTLESKAARAAVCTATYVESGLAGTVWEGRDCG
jgi:nucleoside-diphosphate-sugar epimerase